jgi:hypothetical protein
MTRRGFLTTLLAGAVLDPEGALWRPGAKLISIPAPRVFGPTMRVRVVRQYHGVEGRYSARLDVLYGWGNIPDCGLGYPAEEMDRTAVVTGDPEYVAHRVQVIAPEMVEGLASIASARAHSGGLDAPLSWHWFPPERRA